MDRRQFLRLTGGSAAAAALASWFAPGCGRPPPALSVPDSGRPLLVVLVPQDRREGGRRGRAIGGILNHGGDAVLAALSGVDLVCALPNDIPIEAGEVPMDATWFVLLSHDGGAIRLRSLTLNPPPEPKDGWSDDTPWEQRDAEARAVVAGLASTLLAFLSPAVTVPGTEVSTRAADARKRYVEKAPRGALWGNNSGCGTRYEGGPDYSANISCGMGMVPEVSQRFLGFYVKG